MYANVVVLVREVAKKSSSHNGRAIMALPPSPLGLNDHRNLIARPLGEELFFSGFPYLLIVKLFRKVMTTYSPYSGVRNHAG